MILLFFTEYTVFVQIHVRKTEADTANPSKEKKNLEFSEIHLKERRRNGILKNIQFLSELYTKPPAQGFKARSSLIKSYLLQGTHSHTFSLRIIPTRHSAGNQIHTRASLNLPPSPYTLTNPHKRAHRHQATLTNASDLSHKLDSGEEVDMCSCQMRENNSNSCLFVF